ncbi:DMT(drug/metabolite transporter) superfamily permease [Desulfocurvibacter africanus PCS]|uniref:DMT(Drug/metabolite transporter) superfamily permease n=1 Tax=Desulfocurvibacter africanus PCS TaxID=1262666 RepID=M5PV78_DESAF|nr:DMT family transporter [Desulfocurvibacter africanus]EMG37895.1 DMT(drug/metabolite transporter) superfamily permease [Desulfocurvibacter africanus PCS]
MRDSSRITSMGSLVLAMFMVGSSVVAGRLMVEELPVFLGSALRFALASALLVPALLFVEGGLPRLGKRTWAMLTAQSFLGSFAFTVFLLKGLALTSPASAGIITSATPAFMGLAAWLFFGERPRGRSLAGIVLAVTGVLAINLDSVTGGSELASRPVLGNLLVLAAVGCETLFLLVRKALPEDRQRLSPLAVSTLLSLLGLAFFLPAGLWEAWHHGWPAAGLEAWLAVVWYAVVITVGAYFFWFWGVMRVDGSMAGVATAALPLSSVGLSALVLGERPTAGMLVGCALVLTGILAVSGVRLPKRFGAGNPNGLRTREARAESCKSEKC